MLKEIINHIVAFLSGILVAYFGYRLQKRAPVKERIYPQLERMLRIVRQIAWNSAEAKDFWNRANEYHKALSVERQVKPLNQSFVWGLLCVVSISSMQRLIDNSNEYELAFLELEKSGIIERVRLYDLDLASELFWIHEEAQKILELRSYPISSSFKRIIENISEHAKNCLERLERF